MTRQWKWLGFVLFSCLFSFKSYYVITTNFLATILIGILSHRYRSAGVGTFGLRQYLRKVVLFFVQHSISILPESKRALMFKPNYKSWRFEKH